jgi:hypothetical protein
VLTLRAVRREKSAFDARFFEKSPLFGAIAPAAETFADYTEWPTPAELTRAFPHVPVTFVEAPPRARRGPRHRDGLYDAVIVRERKVPTRDRSWHDYLNALVWATFPRSKLALHTRQHHAIEKWIPPGATQLPNARTRELDMLALIDEGGVLDLGARKVVFGHALYEGLVLDNRAMIARAVLLGEGGDPDASLAQLITSDRLQTPDDLPRVTLS